MGSAVLQSVLGEYRGKPITSISIAIRNAGDGLSKSLEIAPKIVEGGDRLAVLLDGDVTHHDYEYLPKTDSYELKLVMKTETALVVDDAGSAKKLRVMRDKIDKHESAKKGQDRLGGDALDADKLEGDDDD